MNTLPTVSTPPVLTDFNNTWKKRLVSSQAKTREWLFKHAITIYEFQLACHNQEMELPDNGRVYFGSCAEEWLGYSADLARKWAKAGKFIRNFDEDDKHRVLERTKSSDLPISMSTIVEFAAMTDEELVEAEKANLIHPEVTRQDVQTFREQRRAIRKVLADKAQKQAESLERRVLVFEYDSKMPEWLIAKIEDLTATVGIDNIGNELKFTQDEAIFVCTRVNKLWSHTEIAKESTAKEVEQVAAVVSPTTAPESDDNELELNTTLGENKHSSADEFDYRLNILGINTKKLYIEKWALDALIKAARIAYHPDKIGNDEIFNQLPELQEVLSK